MRIERAALLASFVGILGVWPTGLESCAPGPLQALFTPVSEPLDMHEFVKGNIGILQPQFRRRYLLVAYRDLNGTASQDEQTYLLPPTVQNNQWAENPAQSWLQARSKVEGAAQVQYGYLNPYRSNPATNSYYLNCNDDAFLTAKQTLESRVAKLGASSQRVKDWLAAQDMVFKNCSEGSAIPPPLPASADPLDRADRAYQIAAAHFYSGQLDQARDEFIAIGRDAKSPWSDFGPYLAARAMIRAGALGDAEKQLIAIPNDERAQRLLKTVRARMHPVETMAEVARGLTAKRPGDFGDLAASYTWMYDILSNRAGEIEKVAALDDLTDWIHAFQLAGTLPRGYAYQRWQTRHSNPWLIAALESANPGEPADAELITAADRLATGAPAYLSAQYYGALLEEKGGRENEARTRITRLLDRKWPKSARNLLLAARMKLATTWHDFLRDAVRAPAGEDGWDYNPGHPNVKRYDPNAPTLDEDSVEIFRNQIPLTLLTAAVQDAKLPADIRRNLAIATWTRDVLLNRVDATRAVTPVLETYVPVLRPDLEAFRKAGAESAMFAAVYIMLRNPGLHPLPRAGFGRLVPVNELDHLRDNWWCAENRPNTESLSPALRQIYSQGKPEARFLTGGEREAANAEAESLAGIPTGPDFLGEQTLRWAENHPNDPRLPEALHRVVRATRYGCVEPESSGISKRAFTLLHRRFPNSEWTRKTKYWF
jgi:hypothetical protein